jgi:hypothetical protein
MSLLNKAHIKRRTLFYSSSLRGGKFTRVSDSFILELELAVDVMIRSKVRTHPSRGKTLRGGES